ncbi:ran-binding protein 3 isoform X5 [Parus major]|uniref:ran-binding protein 3 isoform X5 n=1 Tax=Parus major TaxID=9157 RepID=UPI001443F74B|nr:ran-binding protein 3 isoform X5 [Parus major]
MADLANEEKPAIAPPVFVFQKDKAQKRSGDGSSPEDGDESDREDGSYCPPVKRERTSSLTQFPPSQSVTKNNVFMPSSFCEPSTGNSDSEPEEKSSGFRLKPPILIHGQAPSAGLPSQKPKEQQRSVLRPAVLQAPQPKAFSQMVLSSGTNGVNIPPDSAAISESPSDATLKSSNSEDKAPQCQKKESNNTSDDDSCEKAELNAHQAFVFGQNLRDRVKLGDESDETTDVQNAGLLTSDIPSATNYFLQYISSRVHQNQMKVVQRVIRRMLLQSLGLNRLLRRPHQKKIQCKLFVFDKSSQSWVERGRGLLRLNDMASTDDGTLQSRLVMRTQGSLRLILNTKLWAQMQIDKASEKSIRITAMDTEDQGVKVFLISASSKDTGQLYAALHHRILALRSRVEQEQEVKNVAPEPEVTQSNEEDSDDDVIAPSGSVGSGPNDEGDGQNTGST